MGIRTAYGVFDPVTAYDFLYAYVRAGMDLKQFRLWRSLNLHMHFAARMFGRLNFDGVLSVFIALATSPSCAECRGS